MFPFRTNVHRNLSVIAKNLYRSPNLQRTTVHKHNIQTRRLFRFLSSSDSFKELDEFRSEGLYCDVKINVQGKTFHCHRVVLASMSPYFRKMLSEKCNEDSSEDFILNNIDAVTFDTILKSMYGRCEPKLDVDNIQAVLAASHILESEEISFSCRRFIRRNVTKLSPTKLFGIFSLLWNDPHNSSEVELDKFILQHLVSLVQHNSFLGIPFNDLNTLLKQYRSRCVPYKYENFLLDGLVRWGLHSHPDRTMYFEMLIDYIDFVRVSAEYVEYLFGELGWPVFLLSNDNDGVSMAVEIKNLVHCGEKSENSTPALLLPYNDPQFSELLTIHLFGKAYPPDPYYSQSDDEYDGSDIENYGQSYDILSLNHFKVERDWCLSSKFMKRKSMFTSGIIKCVALKDHIYCFEGDGRGEFEGPFEVPKFFVYTSLDLSSKPLRTLTSFPILPHFFDFSLCAFDNYSIYLYGTKTRDINLMKKLEIFKPDIWKELNRKEYEGNSFMYEYNINQDTWSPVPAMQRKVKNACLIGGTNLIYLIGGTDKSDNCENTVQAYDPRSQIWLELPKTNFSHKCSAGCYFNGKIFVWNGKHIEMYDPKTQTWEAVENSHWTEEENYSDSVKHVVPYKNQFYLFDYQKDTTVYSTYDPVSQFWSPFTPIESQFSGPIQYAFIFKFPVK